MTRSNSKTNTEHMLLEHIKEWTGSTHIGDDCAVLDNGLLASVDTLVEDVHFCLSTSSFYDIGWKACASNLSDIAAMAGRPRSLLVSLTLPSKFNFNEVRELYRGILDCARTYRVNVVGGDLTSGKLLVVSITVLGHAHELGLVKRSGARQGALVVTTGDFGASKAGLYVLSNLNSDNELKTSAYCVERHLKPKPRLCESWALLRALSKSDKVGALMDSSDGLADALFQIANASSRGIRVYSEKVPVDKETARLARHASADPLDWALYGGEDFELVACVDQSTWDILQSEPSSNPFTIIGVVTSGPDVCLERPDGQVVKIDVSQSFQHFGN